MEGDVPPPYHLNAEAAALPPPNNNLYNNSAIVSGSEGHDDSDDSWSSRPSITRNRTNHKKTTLSSIEETVQNTNDAYSGHKESDDDGDGDGEGTIEKDELYNPNKDDEDEAWVYKNLRGGLEEPISIQFPSSQSTKGTNHSNKKGSTMPPTQQVLKPRNSDAVLSCPCCFQIVCMDCQRHERYSNQFRAMFVMNITVSWDRTVVPEIMGMQTNEEEDGRKAKVPRVGEGVTSIPIDGTVDDGTKEEEQDHGKETYYSVECSSCNTQVAALDMSEEVYYFFGCLESA